MSAVTDFEELELEVLNNPPPHMKIKSGSASTSKAAYSSIID
jgi:hypothetical protein